MTPEELTSDSIASYVTRHGRIDVFHELNPNQSFEELAGRSTRFDLGDGVPVRAAALDDIITAKERVGREKDQAQLPALYAARDELRRGQQRVAGPPE